MTDLSKASPCPFCGGTFLFFQNGAVACDQCQAEGPFCGRQFDAGGSKDNALALWEVRHAP